MPSETTNVLLNAPCPLKVTYSISVFTKDVLQLKVSVGNACRKAHYHHDEMKNKTKPQLFSLDFQMKAVWMLTYL